MPTIFNLILPNICVKSVIDKNTYLLEKNIIKKNLCIKKILISLNNINTIEDYMIKNYSDYSEHHKNKKFSSNINSKAAIQ